MPYDGIIVLLDDSPVVARRWKDGLCTIGPPRFADSGGKGGEISAPSKSVQAERKHTHLIV